MSREKLFIVGVGRSGTSLIQSMLNAHPDVVFLPETQYLRKYVLNHKKWEGEDKANKEFGGDIKLDRLDLEKGELANSCHSFIEVYNKILNTITEEKKARISGDKDPRNLDYIDDLSHFFPEAKVLHIIRDPRDVVLSRTKADWSKGWPFILHAFLYSSQLERGRRKAKAQFGDNYMEFYYEDLLSNSEVVLKKISEFVDIEYTQQMLAFEKSARELVDPSEMQWKKETIGPLLSKNSKKWKTGLSQEQIFWIQKICASTFENHPYTEENVKVGIGKRVLLPFALLVSSVFKVVYPLRLKYLK